MKLDIFMSYQLTLNIDELNLLSRALRGVLKPDEIDIAKKLANHIAEVRITQGKHHAAEMAKLEDNLKKG